MSHNQPLRFWITRTCSIAWSTSFAIRPCSSWSTALLDFIEQLRSLAGSMDGSQYLGGDIIRVVTLDSPALSLSHCHEASGVDVVAAILSLSRDWGEDVASLWRFLHGDADSWLGLESWWVSNLNVKVNIILNLIISSWVLNLNLKLYYWISNHVFLSFESESYWPGSKLYAALNLSCFRHLRSAVMEAITHNCRAHVWGLRDFKKRCSDILCEFHELHPPSKDWMPALISKFSGSDARWHACFSVSFEMAMIMWCRVSLILRSLKLEPAETIDLEGAASEETEGGLDAKPPEEKKSEEVEEEEPVQEVEVEVTSEDEVDASASSSTHSVMPLDEKSCVVPLECVKLQFAKFAFGKSSFPRIEVMSDANLALNLHGDPPSASHHVAWQVAPLHQLGIAVPTFDATCRILCFSEVWFNHFRQLLFHYLHAPQKFTRRLDEVEEAVAK